MPTNKKDIGTAFAERRKKRKRRNVKPEREKS